MERHINYITIGGLFFAILVGLVVFIIWFGRLGVDESKFRAYAIRTTHDISGIAPKTPIKYKGITIGSVQSIGFDEKEVGVVKIILFIQKTLPVTKGSSVIIDSQGLAGLSYLSLRQNTNGTIIENDEDAILTLEQSFLGKLSDRADSALEDISLVLSNIDKLLSNQNIIYLNQTLQSLSAFSAQLPTLSTNLNHTLSSVSSLANNLNAQLGGNEIKNMLIPTFTQTQKSLQNLDALLQKTSNLLDKFSDNPYATIFGEHK